MDRRKFIKTGTGAILASQLAFLSANKTLAGPTDDKSIVWEVSDLNIEKIKALFESLGGIEKYIKKDLSRALVIIKPNICLPDKSEKGTVTSYESIDLFCEVLDGYGIKKLIITDHTLKNAEDFKDIDLYKLEEKYPKLKVMLADKQRLYKSTEVPGKVLKETEILKMISRADMFINFATAKHHSATKVSLAIKNLMGLIWNRIDFHTKLDLHQAIGDLALAIKPHINIIDCTDVLINGGPAGPGPVEKSNKLFCSEDIVAVDSIVTTRYNFGGQMLTPQKIKHLVAASENGVGQIDIENIEIKKV